MNDTTEIYFHVVSDNGNTLTLQQRENIVYKTAWYYDAASDNTKGPLTILPALENVISGWTNVLDQTYTLGVTVFKDNAFTGCDVDATSKKYNCTTNSYTLEERTAKARMLTLQEANGLGCIHLAKSCPVWMYNYLTASINHGGTVDQSGGEYGKNWGYWTMNTWSYDLNSAWYMYHTGSMNYEH